jgi:2-polyprenyl-6-methoxyphenol hydroxylase-like FAD-dependent oxidoreductase
MSVMKSRPRVLISGLGVAGATLAWWLDRRGFAVTVVERAPGPRSGGYMIDFWGPGYTVAERMGLLPQLRAAGYLIDQIRLVKRNGRPLATIGAKPLREALDMRFMSLLRDDLANTLHEQLRDSVDIRFDDRILTMNDQGSKVEVAFTKGRPRTYDLVIGADGLHSDTRAAVIREPVVQPLGYWAASFSAANYPHRDPGAYVSYTTVGRQIARYALRGSRTAFLFVFKAPPEAASPPHSIDEQKAVLGKLYNDGWETREILSRLQSASSLYFDEVSQVRAPRWSRGRIALVGDAAYGPSLLAGEGASLAMAGAYVLAGQLARLPGDHLSAYARYEQVLRPFVERPQKSALKLGGWFAPKTRLGLLARNALSRLAAIPPITRRVVAAMAGQDFDLAPYPDFTLRSAPPPLARSL